MPNANAYECADEVIDIILTDAGLPVSRCRTPDTRNAVACIISQCWNTTGMDVTPSAECDAHIGMFAVPIVQLVRINAHGHDTIPAHVLVKVCDYIYSHHSVEVAKRRKAMADRLEELRSRKIPVEGRNAGPISREDVEAILASKKITS